MDGFGGESLADKLKRLQPLITQAPAPEQQAPQTPRQDIPLFYGNLPDSAPENAPAEVPKFNVPDSDLRTANPIVQSPQLSPLDKARQDYVNAVNSKPQNQKPGLQALHFILEGIKKFTNPQDTTPVQWLGEAKRDRAISQAESRLKPLMALDDYDKKRQLQQEQLRGATLGNEAQAISNRVGSAKADDYLNDKGYDATFTSGDTTYGRTPRGNVKPIPEVQKDPSKSVYDVKTSAGTVKATGAQIISSDLDKAQMESRARSEELKRSDDIEKFNIGRRDDYMKEFRKYREDYRSYNNQLEIYSSKINDANTAATNAESEINDINQRISEIDAKAANEDDFSDPKDLQKEKADLLKRRTVAQNKLRSAQSTVTNLTREQKTFKNQPPVKPNQPDYRSGKVKGTITPTQIRQAAAGYKKKMAAQGVTVDDEEALEYAQQVALSEGYAIGKDEERKPSSKKPVPKIRPKK